MTVSLDGTPRARPLAATQAAESTADISPDGTLVAYQSTETGRPEVFVETFPEKGWTLACARPQVGRSQCGVRTGASCSSCPPATSCVPSM